MTRHLASFVVALAAWGCGSKGPPPRVAEIPIDDYAAPGSKTPVPVVGGGDGVTDSAGAGASSSPGAGGASGAGGGASTGAGASAGLLPAMTDFAGMGGAGAAGAAASPAKPAPSKTEKLSERECNQIMDKYIEVVALSQGISKDAIGGVMGMLRSSVASDPNYANALGACAKENTKTQYRCAMKAADVDGWKKCLQ